MQEKAARKTCHFFLFSADDVRALKFHVQGEHFPAGGGDGIQLLGKLLLQVLVLRDAQQGRACTGKAEGSAGGAHQIFNGLVVRNQLFAVVLVELILDFTRNLPACSAKSGVHRCRLCGDFR